MDAKPQPPPPPLSPAAAPRPSPARRSLPWLLPSLGIGALAAWLRAVAIAGDARAPGGTRAGLALGVAAALLVLFASLLGLRRRRLAAALGSAPSWRRAHVWLGAMACVLSLLHAGPRAGGPLGAALMGLLALVAASGVAGAWIQHALPGAALAIAEEEAGLRAPPSSAASRWLHGWLLVHVPLSLALLVVLALHALVAFRF